MTQAFDKRQFTVHFDSVFTNKKMGNAFKDFLATEHNLDAWNFLTAVKSLETLTDPKDKVKKTKEIIANFIDVGSKEEINISAELRNGVTNTFRKQEDSEEWSIEATPIEVFSDCYKLVVNLLTHDPFKRFVRTPECEAVMKQFKHDSTVISPLITTRFGFDDDYFTHQHFRDRDIDFFLSLFQDSYNWTMIGSKVEDSMNAYVSHTNFFPDVTVVKKYQISKFESVLPCTMDQALLSYFDNEQLYKSDPNCGNYETTEYHTYDDLLEFHKKSNTLDHIQKYKRETAVSNIVMKLPFPFNSRVADYAMTCYYDPENEVFMRIGKTYIKEGKFGTKDKKEVPLKRGADPKKAKVYSLFLFSAGLYKKMDNNRVFYQEVNINNLAGWFSKDALFKVITKDRKDKFRDQMLQLAREFPEDTKIADHKERLFKLVDGKPNGLGQLLINTLEINKSKEVEKTVEKKEKESKTEDIVPQEE
eukprot:gene4522-7900_t